MVKSFSQDAATAGPSSTFVKNAAVAMIMASETSGGIHPSASDSHLSARYLVTSQSGNTVPIGYSDLGYSGRAVYSDLNPRDELPSVHK